MSNYKVDIFKILGQINTKQNNFYKDLTPEEYKSVHPYVLMKWMSGTSDEQQILKLNSFVNPYMFALSNYKDLLFDLLISCAPGKNKRYTWVKKKKQTKLSTTVSVIKQYYNCSSSEAKDALWVLTSEQILQMSDDLGISKDEHKKIQKELKDIKEK